MTNVFTLKRIADEKQAAFVVACKAHGFADEWAFYKAEQAGERIPLEVLCANDEHTKALHAFYVARDGEGGVLGGRA